MKMINLIAAALLLINFSTTETYHTDYPKFLVENGIGFTTSLIESEDGNYYVHTVERRRDLRKLRHITNNWERGEVDYLDNRTLYVMCYNKDWIAMFWLGPDIRVADVMRR